MTYEEYITQRAALLVDIDDIDRDKVREIADRRADIIAKYQAIADLDANAPTPE